MSEELVLQLKVVNKVSSNNKTKKNSTVLKYKLYFCNLLNLIQFIFIKIINIKNLDYFIVFFSESTNLCYVSKKLFCEAFFYRVQKIYFD